MIFPYLWKDFMPTNNTNPHSGFDVAIWSENGLVFVGLKATGESVPLVQHWELPDLDQWVESHEIVACVETDKTVWEISSPCEGRISKVQKKELCQAWNGDSTLWLYALVPMEKS